MELNLKKTLLVGTALVAVSFAGQAQAADLTLTGAATWGTAGNGMVATPTAGDNVIATTNAFTVDGSETGVTTIGAVTSTTGAVTISTVTDAAVSITIGSIDISGAGNLTQSVTNQTTRNVASTITGDVSVGGNLSMTNVEPDAAATNAMSVGGALTVTGTSAITAGNAAAASTTTLTVTGNSTFTGGMTVNGGANAAADATLTLNGATNTGAITLNDGTNGSAILTLSGSAAQTVAGAIAGGAAGEGNIVVTNANGVTFSGIIGATTVDTITVNNDGNDQSVTFTANVATASGISLGDNSGTDTVTATFGGSADTTVAGAIAGGGAADTVALVFTGGKTITVSGAATSNIDTVSVTGTDTVLNSDAAIAATTVTIASGAKLDQGAGAITAAVANSGTIQFTGTGGLTGAITGAGALDVDAATTIAGAITQGTADIAAVTLTQSGGTNAYNVGTTTFSAAGTLALAAGNKAVTGNFTNTTDGQGTITIANGAGTTTIVGNLGASTANSLAALTLGGGTTQTVTTTGNLFVDAVTLDDADILQFLGNSAQTVSGTIVGNGAGDGVLTIGNGTTTSDVTFAGIVGTGAGFDVGAITVSAAATARFNANVTSDAAFTNTGTSIVGVGATVEATTLSDTGSYVLKANDANGTLAAADFGSLTDTGAGGTLTATNLTIDVTGNMTAGTVQLLTGIQTGAATLVDNSYQYDFTVANNGANTDVTVAKKTIASMSDNVGNAGVATALDGIVIGADTDLDTIVDNVADAVDQAAVNEVLEAVAPTVDGGSVLAGLQVSGQASDIVSYRMASLRDGSSETGMVAGDMSNGLKVWGQAFGKLAEMDKRDGVDGFDADTYGVAVGVDTSNISDKAVVGLAFSYGNTDVTSKNATRTNTDVDSYQLTAYGDVDLDDRTYLSGQVAYAWNSIDSTRYDVGGISGLNANGDTDSNQFSIGAEVGRDYQTSQGFVITPSVSSNYTYVSVDNYTETGAGGANLTVNTENFNVLDLGVAVKTSWNLEQSDGSVLKPVLGVGYTYDVIADEVETSSSLAGASATSFKSKGADAERSEFNIDAGITYFSADNWELTANYDLDVSSSYKAHSGYLKAAYKF